MQILKNPIVWFIVSPIIVVGLLNLFIPLGYRAFHEVLASQVAVEEKIKSLSCTIDDCSALPRTQDIQNQINDLDEQLKKEQEKFLHFRNDWGGSVKSALKRYFARGMVAVGDSYASFLYLLMVSVMLVHLAAFGITNYPPNIPPFYIRIGSLSAGSVVALIAIAQWLFATVRALRWYQMAAGMFMVPAAIVWLIVCWVIFIKKFLAPYIRSSYKKF